MHPRPEKSLQGTWSSGGTQIECRPDGSVGSGQTSKLVTWQGSRFVFDEAELIATAREYRPGQTQWDVVLARQCGLIRTSQDLFDGPHVNHRQVGQTIEATVRWADKDHFELDKNCYARVADQPQPQTRRKDVTTQTERRTKRAPDDIAGDMPPSFAEVGREYRKALVEKAHAIYDRYTAGELDLSPVDAQILDGLRRNLPTPRPDLQRAMALVEQHGRQAVANLDRELNNFLEQRTGERPLPEPPAKPPEPKTDQAVHEQEIPLSAIADSPFQLRKTYQGIERLKDTLLTHGLLQAIVVRSLPGGRFELLAGHRRCAAARLAGWKQIRATNQQVSDSEAEEIVVIENLQREDLSAIEEARGYQAMLKRPNPPTQEALAERLGVSQAHVANRLRYLRLPAEWQDAIISGEIPHTHARAILPYCDDPRAAAAIATLPAKLFVKPKGKKGKPPVTEEEDAQPLAYDELVDALRTAFTKSGTPMGYHSEHDKKSGKWLRLPDKLTDAMRERLDVVEVKAESDYGDRVMQVARNRSAWFEIAREHAKREEERYANRGNGKKKKSDKPREEMTAAERKQAAADEARNKKKRQEQLERRRREISADWKRLLIGKALADPARTGKEVLMACMIYMTQTWKMSHFDCDFADAAEEVTGHKGDLLDCLAKGGIDAPILWDIARVYAGRAFVDGEGNPMSMTVDDSDLDLMVTWLKIDLEAAWLTEQMGGLSEAWWEAHDRDALATIGGGICVDSHMKKGEMVYVLTSSGSIPFPSELRPAKATNGKRKRH